MSEPSVQVPSANGCSLWAHLAQPPRRAKHNKGPMESIERNGQKPVPPMVRPPRERKLASLRRGRLPSRVFKWGSPLAALLQAVFANNPLTRSRSPCGLLTSTETSGETPGLTSQIAKGGSESAHVF